MEEPNLEAQFASVFGDVAGSLSIKSVTSSVLFIIPPIYHVTAFNFICKMSSPLKIEPVNSPRASDLSSTSASLQSGHPLPYTAFSQHQKYVITCILGITTIISPLTATIYFPLLPLLQAHFHTSAQAISLTITIYLVSRPSLRCSLLPFRIHSVTGSFIFSH